MKPGCFLKSIIILTILVAAIMYIVQHRSRLFFEPGKKIITGLLNDNLDKEFRYVKDTPEKARLKGMLESYVKSLKFESIPEDNKIDKIVALIKAAAKDSVITGSELDEISNNLNTKKNYERPE